MKNLWWKGTNSYFCRWPYCICRFKIYGRRVFEWIMQYDLIRSAVVNLLVFAPLFNTSKKHVLTHFVLEMAAVTCTALGWLRCFIMEMIWLHMCSLISTLSSDHQQNFPLPSALLWDCGLKHVNLVLNVHCGVAFTNVLGKNNTGALTTPHSSLM